MHKNKKVLEAIKENAKELKLDMQNIDPMSLSVAKIFRPSVLTKALVPINSGQKDKYLHIKEQWLLEKHKLQHEINKHNES